MGDSPQQPDGFDALRRAGAFLLVVIVAWILIPAFIRGDTILRSAAATFLAGLLANLVIARVFEDGGGGFASFGLGWQQGSTRELILGFVVGLGSVAALTGVALGFGIATLERVPVERAWPLPVLVVLLALGALGEELMFRGYGFQILARCWSARGTIAITGALFGVAHLLSNAGINFIGAMNTALWGSLLGYACWHTKALWLPTGLHFGWNLGLVAIGAPLSGLTIKATGFALQWSAGELLSGGTYGPENGLLTTICAGAVFVILRGARFEGTRRAGGDS